MRFRQAALLLLAILSPNQVMAEWTKVSSNVTGNTFYLDFDRIKKHDGFVYWWQLTDLLKPTQSGTLSGQIYSQGDCGPFRYKNLSYILHKQPMGRDAGDRESSKNPEWNYPDPDSVDGTLLKLVCE